MKQVDVLVAGQGLVASTLALRLAQADFKVGWCTRGQRQIAPALAQRTLSVAPWHVNTLTDMGLGELLAKHAAPYTQMQLWSDSISLDQAIQLDAKDTVQDNLGSVLPLGPWLSALHAVLLAHERVEECDALPATLETWVTHQQLATHAASVLVIADGPVSPWCAVTGFTAEDMDYHDYAESAWCAVATCEQEHDGISRQRFLTDGPLALLPLNTPNQVGIVWTQTPEAAKQLLSQTSEAQAAALTDACEAVLGKIKQVEHACAFPLTRWHTQHYARPRVIRIGESAHGVHPLAGLGGNMGLWDVEVLLKAFIRAREQEQDLGGLNVLTPVARQRRTANHRRQREIDAIHALSKVRRQPLQRGQAVLQRWAQQSFASPAGATLTHLVAKRANQP